jgi:ribose transport system ATP-binding protein
MDENAYLTLNGVSKEYGGIAALKDVNFEARRGSIHAILGENGAGKSTLIKTLAGVVRADKGTIRLDGQMLAFRSPAEATAAGIVTIFQELSVVPHLTVAENICLVDPPRSRFGLIDRRAQRRRAAKALAAIGCEPIDPDRRCLDLPLPKRQIVEIAKAVALDPKVLILDEATSALTETDVRHVLEFLLRLKRSGTTILYISHRMREIQEIADRCSVFRNGEHIATFDAGTRSEDDIVRMMIGRPIAQIYPPKPQRSRCGDPLLRVRDLCWESRLRNIHFDLRAGEIVGLGGLDGQGQRELLLALFGVLRGTTGTISIAGEKKAPSGPGRAKWAPYHIALIPEDRKTEGLFLDLSIAENLAIGNIEHLTRGGFIDADAEAAMTQRLMQDLQIKAPKLAQPVSTLSGGNQQKVVIAKWLAISPRILLLLDPTRGIDVGTKQQIYALFRRLAAEGMAILYYSTDYDELIGLCDEVHVLYQGRIAATLAADAMTESAILAAAMGNANVGVCKRSAA